MKISVVTLYEGITNEDVQDFADRVFDTTWAKDAFSPESWAEMKSDFLKGEDVVAQSTSADEKKKVATRWRLMK